MVRGKFIFISLILSFLLIGFVSSATAVRQGEEGGNIIVTRNLPSIEDEDIVSEDIVSEESEPQDSSKKIIFYISTILGVIIILLIIFFIKRQKKIEQDIIK